MIETDTVELDTDLLGRVHALDSDGLPDVEAPADPLPQEKPKAGSLFEDDEIEGGVELALNGIEHTIRSFVNASYEMGETKKEFAIIGYANLLKKYQGGTPAWIMKYKEEGFAFIMTIVLVGSIYLSVKAARETNEKALDEANKSAPQSRLNESFSNDIPGDLPESKNRRQKKQRSQRG